MTSSTTPKWTYFPTMEDDYAPSISPETLSIPATDAQEYILPISFKASHNQLLPSTSQTLDIWVGLTGTCFNVPKALVCASSD
jgi:hypothetical protein